MSQTNDTGAASTAAPSWALLGGDDERMLRLDRWIQAHPGQAARLDRHVGHLTFQSTFSHGRMVRRSLRICDPRRAPRSKYRTITIHDIDRLQLKLPGDSRYHSALELI